MVEIDLERMGVDFYTEEDKKASDMGNFRLRPHYVGLPCVSNYYLKDRHGHYISGDFRFFRPSKGQEGYPEPQLALDFTDYGEDMKDSKRYKFGKECDKYMPPTLASIKAWLEYVLGEKVKLTLEQYQDNE